MYRLMYSIFFIGVTIIGHILTDYLFKKIGLLVILSPGPIMIGYGLMKVARFNKY